VRFTKVGDCEKGAKGVAAHVGIIPERGQGQITSAQRHLRPRCHRHRLLWL
jgi:hypothetical protein